MRAASWRCTARPRRGGGGGSSGGGGRQPRRQPQPRARLMLHLPGGCAAWGPLPPAALQARLPRLMHRPLAHSGAQRLPCLQPASGVTPALLHGAPLSTLLNACLLPSERLLPVPQTSVSLVPLCNQPPGLCKCILPEGLAAAHSGVALQRPCSASCTHARPAGPIVLSLLQPRIVISLVIGSLHCSSTENGDRTAPVRLRAARSLCGLSATACDTTSR